MNMSVLPRWGYVESKLGEERRTKTGGFEESLEEANYHYLPRMLYKPGPEGE